MLIPSCQKHLVHSKKSLSRRQLKAAFDRYHLDSIIGYLICQSSIVKPGKSSSPQPRQKRGMRLVPYLPGNAARTLCLREHSVRDALIL